MSTSWSRQIGSLVGGTLAGPAGAIIGGIGGSILGKATGVDDPIRDAIGGVMGDQAGNLLTRLNPEEKQQVNHDLQTAFRDAFREALYDVGGTFCFPSAWQSSNRALPADISAPLMALKHAQDELAAQVCERLQAVEEALDEEHLFPLQPLKDEPAAAVYAYVAAQPPDDLEEAFFELVWPHVGEITNLQRELDAYHFNLRSYLRRHLFNRLLIHLGEHLKQRPEAWRAFNRLVLEEMRLRVLALDSGQTHITKQLEQIIAQLSRSHADNSQDRAISSLTDKLADSITATGRVERKLNEGFDGLLARVDEQHNEVITYLRGLIGIEETGRQTLARVEDVAKQVERVEQKVDQLRQPPSSPTLPRPFTAPKPPKQFVNRPAEFEALIERLLASGSQRTVAITTALQGGGGFGKTTLAQAICHDERIKQAFGDGILWVTIGQTPSLVELLSVQIKFFAPTETYTDINAAAARLRALLTGKCVLVVLDDVWQEYHARPFIQQDSLTCAYLITTRQQEIARWLQAQTVTVNEMQTSQAVDLLIKWLAGTQAVEGVATDEALLKQLHQLAEYLGEWPLLLELVATQLRDLAQRRWKSLSQAIQDVRKRLMRRGFTAFDRKREKERNRAISISLDVSLDELDVLCEDVLGDKDIWWQRYLELSIFPEDIDIPLTTIFKLWEGTASFDELDSEDALVGMQNLSLFTRYDADKQTVRLHDVIRAVIAQQVENLPDLHRQFLSAYGLTNWADLPADEPYLWQHLAYHLHEAGQHDKLCSLLLSFSWLEGKLNTTDINALLADYEWLPDDKLVERVARTLRQAGHVLAEDKNQLAGQLLGRLLGDQSTLIQSLLTQARPRHLNLWLRPLTPSLQETSALIRTLQGHTSGVFGVAVTPDGRLAISASYDRTVKVWDVESGQELHELRSHTDSVNGVAVTPDGRLTISASSDKMLKVWNIESGQEFNQLHGHTDSVKGVAVTPDGRLAISASRDKTVKVWDIESGQERLSLAGHTDSVNGVAVTPNGRLAISASDDKTLKVWDIESGLQRDEWRGHKSSVTGVTVTPDGRLAISASRDKTVKVWDIESGQERLSLAGHTHWVNAVAVTPDGRLAISTGNKRLKVWDIESGLQRNEWYGHASYVIGVAVTPGGGLAISASDDQTLKVWDIESGQERDQQRGHTAEVWGVAVTLDGRLAISAFGAALKVWDIESGQERYQFRCRMSTVRGVAVTPDGRLVIFASGPVLKIWDIESGQQRDQLLGHTAEVWGVAVTLDGQLAISVSDDKTLKVWDIESGQERNELRGHTDGVKAVAVTPDGRLAISASDDKTLKVWDIESGQQRNEWRGHTDWVRGVSITPNGRLAISASWDKTLKVWDIESGLQRNEWRGHTSGVNGVAVTPDGRLAISVSEDKTFKVWKLSSGRCLTTFHLNEPLLTCAVTPDGMTIVAGGVSGRVHFLRLEGLLSTDLGSVLNG